MNPILLSVLWQYPNFKWALVNCHHHIVVVYFARNAGGGDVLYPRMQKPANDSLDFVRTLGRLYYDRKDHQNLASKMAAVFLDVVKTRYHVATQNLDAHFIDVLQ